VSRAHYPSLVYAEPILGQALTILTLIFRAYLGDQSMEHLSSALKRGGVKDLIDFFPPNKRNITILDAHFREKGLPVVAEWYARKLFAAVKEVVVNGLRDLSEKEEGVEAVRVLESEKGQTLNLIRFR
jgi:hypothetical protein